jgi:hypothetical protein
MKHKNWHEWSNERKVLEVENMSPFRRNYLLRQALDSAIREMNTAEFPDRSDIEDMEMILEILGGTVYRS